MNGINSDEVMRLVATRAQLVSLAQNPAISPLAKQVGMVLWAITETWAKGEMRYVTRGQIADHIAWYEDRTVKVDGKSALDRHGKALRVRKVIHPDQRRVGEALNALQAEATSGSTIRSGERLADGGRPPGSGPAVARQTTPTRTARRRSECGPKASLPKQRTGLLHG